MKQVAALPYNLADNGNVQVMIITSRRTRRWVIPKGHPMKGKKDHEAAMLEAFEEAGLKGAVSNKPLGTFRYRKRLGDRAEADIEVTVFAMRVTGEAKGWPERQQRERRWLDPISAARMVDDVELKRLLLDFAHRTSASGALEP